MPAKFVHQLGNIATSFSLTIKILEKDKILPKTSILREITHDTHN
jgi:hypothetical protein